MTGSAECYVQQQAATLLPDASNAQDTQSTLQLVSALAQFLNSHASGGSSTVTCGNSSHSAQNVSSALRQQFLNSLSGVVSANMSASQASQVVSSLVDITNSGSLDSSSWDLAAQLLQDSLNAARQAANSSGNGNPAADGTGSSVSSQIIQQAAQTSSNLLGAGGCSRLNDVG